eukprot:CAMPEP_0194371334 /NCGR_PEP_ID=MMETSP0174-20130528/19741_1 /TAXON_ID=216777 /ORGANISM="Proboscia alata, Strain PI-D3" /LENGTH=241 /DNA_ID=CAMNT_0039149331 /DNA_START=112 /DNA_END=834 /DNA_ORIENTATION=+
MRRNHIAIAVASFIGAVAANFDENDSNSTMTPSSLPSYVPCKWEGFNEKSSCENYSPFIGQDCDFNAANGFSCSAVARSKCDLYDIKFLEGCYDSCRIFHEECCCPPVTLSPTGVPTVPPPSEIPTTTFTSVPSANPTIECLWNDFRKRSSCDDYNLLLGEDCMFMAGVSSSSCMDVAGSDCDNNEIKAVDGCYDSCVIFHVKCCCPAETHSPTASPTVSLVPSSDPTSAPSDSPSIFCKW